MTKVVNKLLCLNSESINLTAYCYFFEVSLFIFYGIMQKVFVVHVLPLVVV